MNSDSELRTFICEIGRRMYARNLVAATDGNISVRLGEDRFLCTPSGVSKGFMQPDDLVVANASGELVEGTGKVTSEIFTHLAAYEERPEINAVVHAHPPTAVGLSVAGVSMTEPVLPEVLASIGGIPCTEYATPGTIEGASVIRELIRECDAVMLDRHGAVTVGETLLDAYLKMEKVEHAAESLLVACQLGDVRRLTREEIEKLYEARLAYGAKGKVYRVE